MFEGAPKSYRDPFWSNLAAQAEKEYSLPQGLLRNILTKGERSNADQVSSAGARTPFQIIEPTRQGIQKNYGFDPYESPKNAARGAAALLRESLDRNQGDVTKAVQEYHGGTDPKNYGPINRDYVKRVTGESMENKGSRVEELIRLYNEKKAQQSPEPQTKNNRVEELIRLYNEKKASEQPSVQPSDVPTPENLSADQAQPLEQQPGLIERNWNNLVGLGEAGLSAITGATGGAIGGIVGTASGLADSVRSGTFGTQKGVQQVQDRAIQGAQNLTYEPRTETGKEMVGAVGEAASALPPFVPAVGQAGAITGSARASAPVAGLAAKNAAQAAGKAAKSSAEIVKRLPAAVQEKLATQERINQRSAGSVGAQGVDQATLRKQAAAELPVPIQLTKGDASRDFAQQQFEKEAAKNAELGEPLRKRKSEQAKGLLMNIESFIDQTGASAGAIDDIQTGTVITKALIDRAKKDKAQIKELYNKAYSSPESQNPIQINSVIDYINANTAESKVSPLLKFAREKLVELGMAKKNRYGMLEQTPNEFQGSVYDTAGRAAFKPPVKLIDGERWRKAINAATGTDKPDIRQATILKSLYDTDTESAGGPLFKSARRANENFVKRFENRALIADLIETKRNSDDRRVAVEDVQKRIIDKGSREDFRMLSALLQNSGEEGKQALRDLRGAELRRIKDEVTISAVTDSYGVPTISADKLNKSIVRLDRDGKLEALYGKKGAEQLRTLNDVAKVILTSPPGSVNTSNTASVLAGLFDVAISGTSGVPVPLATGGRLIIKKIKDKKLQARINDALNDKKSKEK